jgi:hypothetical protein
MTQQEHVQPALTFTCTVTHAQFTTTAYHVCTLGYLSAIQVVCKHCTTPDGTHPSVHAVLYDTRTGEQLA